MCSCGQKFDETKNIYAFNIDGIVRHSYQT